MPARHIQTYPNLGTAVAVGRDPETSDEAWLIDPTATADQIVKAAAQYLAIDNARCTELRHKGQRRALWLLLAVVAGMLLPSPLRGLYGAQEWLLTAGVVAGYAAVVVLLTLALHEHLGMRRLWADKS